MQPPSAFISYSWDNESHQAWVRDFAARLRRDGVAVTLDQWHIAPGDQLPAFMEQSIRMSDFVLVVCTPKYKARSDQRLGGVGYEGDIIQAEVFLSNNHRKFVPILRAGSWRDSSPSALSGKFYIDLASEPYDESQYFALLSHLHNTRATAPDVGAPPENVFRNFVDVDQTCVVRLERSYIQPPYKPQWYEFFRSAEFDRTLEFSVFEDGVEVGSIQNGGVFEYQSTAGYHKMFVSYWTSGSVPVADGMFSTVHIKGRSDELRTLHLPGTNVFVCDFKPNVVIRTDWDYDDVNLFLRPAAERVKQDQS